MPIIRKAGKQLSVLDVVLPILIRVWMCTKEAKRD